MIHKIHPYNYFQWPYKGLNHICMFLFTKINCYIVDIIFLQNDTIFLSKYLYGKQFEGMGGGSDSPYPFLYVKCPAFPWSLTAESHLLRPPSWPSAPHDLVWRRCPRGAEPVVVSWCRHHFCWLTRWCPSSVNHKHQLHSLQQQNLTEMKICVKIDLHTSNLPENLWCLLLKSFTLGIH